MKLFNAALQLSVLIIIAPLLSGIIRKIKNNLRLRVGPGIFQPYYNIAKLFSKDEVISVNSSCIFRIAPYVVLSSSVAALALVPAFMPQISFWAAGDFLAVIFLLALGRFFLALAGLDTGSSFGGMGSSREMFISSFVEPAAILAIFAVSVAGGTTNMASLSLVSFVRPSAIVAAVAFFIVLLAETSRLPIDNQETHLELTMIHEAMVLEYSGPSLALIDMAAHIKQILFMTIAVNAVLPPAVSNVLLPFAPLSGFAFYCLKILIVGTCVALLEVSIAKMRLFRSVDFLLFGFLLSAITFIIAILGF
ncbi:MAG: NADH-quinone oxidoreductase subunit H [Endomicrobiales bacterium]|nr:NADH-quinone oxidoreductase subunit H [Endomicrobiales bacterium]